MTVLLVLALLIILLLIVAIVRLLYINYKISLILKTNKETKKLRTLAYTDALTGVYNRNAYNMHISEFKRLEINHTMGIILFDVDNFKCINDSKGHLAGDDVLIYVANSLKRVFPNPKNNVYRIGGDEFAVISRNTNETEIIDSLIVLRKILEKESDIRLSNGYSIITGNIKSAFKYADEMLYADKFSKK